MSESERDLHLRSCVTTLRSRNAGSFYVTIDAVFTTTELYDAWAASGLLEATSLAPRFGLAPEDISVIWFPPAMAVKLTVPRTHTAGGPRDTDTDGAQLFVLLLDLALLPADLS